MTLRISAVAVCRSSASSRSADFASSRLSNSATFRSSSATLSRSALICLRPFRPALGKSRLTPPQRRQPRLGLVDHTRSDWLGYAVGRPRRRRRSPQLRSRLLPHVSGEQTSRVWKLPCPNDESGSTRGWTYVDDECRLRRLVRPERVVTRTAKFARDRSDRIAPYRVVHPMVAPVLKQTFRRRARSTVLGGEPKFNKSQQSARKLPEANWQGCVTIGNSARLMEIWWGCRTAYK